MKKSLLLVPLIFGLLILVISSINEISRSEDADADGISDDVDNCIGLVNPSQKDFDLDNMGNECDADDDNDAIIDYLDVFDEDPLEWADFDFDTIGSNQDSDDDNDGISDLDDTTPVLTSESWTKENLEQIQDCAVITTDTSKLLCYEKFFENLVKSKQNAFDALDLAFSLSKIGALDDCHFVSHEIGHAAFDKNPSVYENLVGIDGTVCRGGFYHGILASYFHEIQKSGKPIPDSYTTICDNFIGDYNYNHCLHGLGHGLVHYYQDSLESSIALCDRLSFYQNDLCISGIMMQYTDNKITTYGLEKENIANLCPKSQLNNYDYLKCTTSLGVTLAFHTDHNFEKASTFCEMINEQDGKKLCIAGLEQEVVKAKREIESPPKEEHLGRLQPVWIKQGDKKWIVDFRSPATISDFEYDEETKTIQFSFDFAAEIRIYAASDILPEKMQVTINGVEQKNVSIDSDKYEGYIVIIIMPTQSGTAHIIPL